jgi:putative PIN family toxin of toxin-antitoxin system
VIVVLDSSVWVSALRFDGVPARALKRALTIDQLAISEFIENEVIRVLVTKFGIREEFVRMRLTVLLEQVCRVETHGFLPGACRDPNDDAVLETAVNAGAQLLVTGDKDLLILKSFQSIAIVTPAEYLSVGS